MNLSIKTKKLSIITDVILFLFVVLIFILLIQKLDLPSYNEYEETMALFNSGNYKSVEEENEVYIKKIRNDFGINILYGKEVADYAASVNAVEQYDQNIINNNLKQIYAALQTYPDDVFDIFKSRKYPLYIMIVDKFNNNTLALASRNSLNQYRLFVSNTNKFERAFHHEMFHILEYYMSDKKKNLYANWNDFNPDGFMYESNTSKLDNDYVYTSYSNGENVNMNPYFVTKYSKASDKEDRAEIFAELMIATKKPSYLGEGQNIKKKADEIDASIVENITSNKFPYDDILN
ncbi:MAG: hypothetical protein Q4D02_03070 [Clostridia bacterium]|nr:hypothetical protein [Clostridia bacterium]